MFVVNQIARSSASVLTKNIRKMSANAADFARKNQEAAAILKNVEFQVSS